MGRITVFSLDDCRHCRRVKGALKEREIPFTEISLSSYPNKRSDMLSLADQLTVPQIFFNEEHIGGADDTMSVLEKWDRERKYPTPLDRYKREIKSEPDPTDPRLAVPTEPPHEEAPPLPRNEKEDSIPLPGGSEASVLDLTLRLMKCMPSNDLSYLGTNYRNCFKGTGGVMTIMEEFHLEEKEDAVAFGRLLQERKILHHVTDDNHKFGDSGYYFRLQPYHTPKVINTFRVWTDRVDPDPVALIHRLKKELGRIVSRATDRKGGVNYLAAADDDDFWTFEEAVCELQCVDMAGMDDKTKLAFGINLYNLMITHAFIKVGIPSNTAQRGSFFGQVSYDVGGHIMSFSELENGVLRSNSRAPFSLASPFPQGDPRLELKVKEVDPRIHFGLNCGAKSCPPVKKFTATAVEEELRIVAQAFCEQDDNVMVDEEKNELHLNMILSWYRADFAPSASKLPGKVVTYLRGNKQAKLQRMIEGRKDIKIKFNAYDWSTNASENKPFKSANLKKRSRFSLKAPADIPALQRILTK